MKNQKQYYLTKENFLTLKTEWNKRKEHSAAEHIIYNILRNKHASLGFCPRVKVHPGESPIRAFLNAKHVAIRMLMPSQKYIKVTTRKFFFFKKTVWVIQDVNTHLEEFKSRFGFDMPDGLADKVKESSFEE